MTELNSAKGAKAEGNFQEKEISRFVHYASLVKIEIVSQTYCVVVSYFFRAIFICNIVCDILV